MCNKSEGSFMSGIIENIKKCCKNNYLFIFLGGVFLGVILTVVFGPIMKNLINSDFIVPVFISLLVPIVILVLNILLQGNLKQEEKKDKFINSYKNYCSELSADHYSVWRNNFKETYLQLDKDEAIKNTEKSFVRRLRNYKNTNDVNLTLLIPLFIGPFLKELITQSTKGINIIALVVVMAFLALFGFIIISDILNIKDKIAFCEDCLEICNEELTAIQNKNNKEINN